MGFTSQTLSELQTLFLPIVLVTVSTVASSLALAQIVQRWTNTDRQTALLACAPGGLSQMGMIADELGADVVIVNVFQLTRLVAAIVILPIVIRLLLGV